MVASLGQLTYCHELCTNAVDRSCDLYCLLLSRACLLLWARLISMLTFGRTFKVWHARLCRLHILFLLDCEVEVPSRTVHFISHRLTLLMCPKIIFRLQFFSFSSTLIMPPKTIFRLQAFFFSSRRNYHSNDNVCRAIEYQLQDAREAVAI